MLTADCMHTITKFTRLGTLDLSHNALGPPILQQLPRILQTMPLLREINLSDTHLGKYTLMGPETQEAYESYGLTVPPFSLILHFSGNHFERDTLWHWTNMWRNLGRITCLYLSNISCDTAWDNFDVLSDLPK